MSDLEVWRGDPGTQELREAETRLAPSTAGELLRNFDLGAGHDLPRVHLRLQQRVRAHQPATAGTMDLDSRISEQCSPAKEGAPQAYNGATGDQPVLAFWAAEGEVLFSHLRRGRAYTACTIRWFLREPDKRGPATASKSLRADSGFYSKSVVEWGEAQGFLFTIPAEPTAPLLEASAALSEQSWGLLPAYDLAEVAELRSQPTGWRPPYRDVVTRELAGRKPGELYWKSQATVTHDAVRCARALVVWHLQQATRENAIKEHKRGLSLEKLPTQKFHANWAYLLIGPLAVNLLAWCKRLVLPPAYPRATSKTIRQQLLN